MPASPKEDPFCMYKEEHIKEGVSHCKNSIIGKILSSKPILKSILQNSLLGMWGNPKGFTITEIEGGLFHISMESEADTQRIIKGNPWTVRNCWFSVRHWDRSINPRNIDFNHIPTWIQIWGLPLHCKTTTMGQHLGTQLGKVEEAALYDYPQKARIVKIKVNINVEDPIRPGMFIGNTKDGITWVDFRYENIPMFCFNCGLIGHTEDKCSYSTPNSAEGGTNPIGPWLRSNIYGRRVNDKRDKRFNSNPMQSLSGGQFSPIPKSMLDMLAKMKLEEEREEAPQAEDNSHTNHEEPQQEKTSTTSSMKPYNQSPTMPKRKFLKIQSHSQRTTDAADLNNSQNTMACLANKASQFQ
jgi:hypothetical protein